MGSRQGRVLSHQSDRSDWSYQNRGKGETKTQDGVFCFPPPVVVGWPFPPCSLTRVRWMVAKCRGPVRYCGRQRPFLCSTRGRLPGCPQRCPRDSNSPPCRRPGVLRDPGGDFRLSGRALSTCPPVDQFPMTDFSLPQGGVPELPVGTRVVRHVATELIRFGGRGRGGGGGSRTSLSAGPRRSGCALASGALLRNAIGSVHPRLIAPGRSEFSLTNVSSRPILQRKLPVYETAGKDSVGNGSGPGNWPRVCAGTRSRRGRGGHQ